VQARENNRSEILSLPLAAVAILIIAGTLLSPAVSFPFLQWDDQLHITANPFMKPDAADRYLHFWKHPYGKMYVPIAYNTWTILYGLGIDKNGEPTPEAFHLANVGCHALNSLLVLLLLKRLRFSLPGAVAGAILFCVHPLQVEAVAWVAEWRGLLATLLSLAAIHAHVSRWNVKPEKR
jgi:hypothetical protein